MPRVALLTTALDPGYVTDDHLLVPFLRGRGIEPVFARWREETEWGSFDLVVVRSTWDYHRDPGRFLRTLATIAASTRLENPLPLQRWNARKSYLRDLAGDGIPIVPTTWIDTFGPAGLGRVFDEVAADEIVLKPVIGASGEDTFRLSAAEAGRREGEVLAALSGRAVMAQPFLAGVLDRGETSVVWIGGEPSHALRKIPRPGEFRSQEEHGGRVERVPLDAELGAAAARVEAAVRRRAGRAPLYGRVDFLPGPDGWLLGELELIEPSLYLRVDPEAPRRFADGIAAILAGG